MATMREFLQTFAQQAPQLAQTLMAIGQYQEDSAYRNKTLALEERKAASQESYQSALTEDVESQTRERNALLDLKVRTEMAIAEHNEHLAKMSKIDLQRYDEKQDLTFQKLKKDLEMLDQDMRLSQAQVRDLQTDASLKVIDGQIKGMQLLQGVIELNGMSKSPEDSKNFMNVINAYGTDKNGKIDLNRAFPAVLGAIESGALKFNDPNRTQFMNGLAGIWAQHSIQVEELGNNYMANTMAALAQDPKARKQFIKDNKLPSNSDWDTIKNYVSMQKDALFSNDVVAPMIRQSLMDIMGGGEKDTVPYNPYMLPEIIGTSANPYTRAGNFEDAGGRVVGDIIGGAVDYLSGANAEGEPDKTPKSVLQRSPVGTLNPYAR
jgi:hypothetical protein